MAKSHIIGCLTCLKKMQPPLQLGLISQQKNASFLTMWNPLPGLCQFFCLKVVPSPNKSLLHCLANDVTVALPSH